MKRFTVLSLMALLAIGSAGCDPCGSLEQKLCDDLGAEDCRVWRTSNGPDVLYSGQRSFKFCLNARFSLYDVLREGARAHTDAVKGSAKAGR